MKISILSMQKVANFGSLLQGYSLMKILNELGHEVSFIDIQGNESDSLLMREMNCKIIVENEGNSKLLSKIKKVDRYVLNRIRIRESWKSQKVLFEEFRCDILKIKDKDNDDCYDVCVIGSDEVFNCTAPFGLGFTSQLFGNVSQARDVITYAASCGANVYENLSNPVIKKIEEAFQRVSVFSVRDLNTENFVHHLSDKKVIRHFDPVVIGDFSKELERTSLPVDLPNRYCIIYSYYNRFHKREEISKIKEFCKKNNLEPIGLGSPQKWININLSISPFEALKVFESAKFIITDTFHGTIFSAKFNGKFAVIIRDSNRNKLGDLVKCLGIERHLVNDLDELQRVYSYQNSILDFKAFAEREKNRTLKYLNNYLSL